MYFDGGLLPRFFINGVFWKIWGFLEDPAFLNGGEEETG
jgi:hypothetical protein